MDAPVSQNQTINASRVHQTCQREYSPKEHYPINLRGKHRNKCLCSSLDGHNTSLSSSTSSSSSSSCSSLSSIVQSSQLMAIEDDMEAVHHEIEDFNQINLNTINSNIATNNSNYCSIMKTTTSNSHTHLNTSNSPLSMAMDALEYSMAQSPLNRRRHTALPQALIMNQQHLSLLENKTHKMDYITDDSNEYKPILRKALSTPACNIMGIQNPLKSDVTIITNHTSTSTQHHQQPTNVKHQPSNQTVSANNNISSSQNRLTVAESIITSSTSTTITTSSSPSLPTQRSGCAHYKRSCMFVVSSKCVYYAIENIMYLKRLK